MPQSDDRKYFIVKHDLDSFKALPGFIWRTGWRSRTKAPPKFNQIKIEDCWVEFAYIKDEIDHERCSIITGFYECTHEAWPGKIPLDRANLKDFADWEWEQEAWMIEGKPYGRQPEYPVSVPPINEMLGKIVFGRGAIIPGFSAREFERIREETLKRQLDPKKIPLLEREPLNEQELLSVIVDGYRDLGIEKIIEVQTHFPDMLVKINGNEVYFELEVQSLGFWDHIKKKQLRRISEGKFKGKLEAKLKNKNDNRPVAILCWDDNDKEYELEKSVRNLRVYELQSLLREGTKIT
jgi:hypothetical protein